MLNRAIIMGRLGRDPEGGVTQGGVSWARVNLGVDRDFKDKASGERATDWITVTAWRSTADFIKKYFTKGRMMVVEGRIQTGTYTDRDGAKRIKFEIVADSVYFGDSQRSSFGTPTDQDAPPAPGQFEELNDDDGELPF